LKYLVKMPALREIDFYWSDFESTKFASALCRLRDRAKYHHSRLIQCINDPVFEELAREWVNGKVESPSHFMERHSQLNDIIDPELAALLQAIRSQFDIFGQIINEEILDGKLNQFSVETTFKRVINHLSESKLKDFIQSVKQHENFKYIDEFVNNNKHVIIPNLSWGINGNENRMMDGTVIHEFSRQHTIYPQKELVWILESLKPWVDSTFKELCLYLKESQVEKLTKSNEEWTISE
jgi:hypothetical protein